MYIKVLKMKYFLRGSILEQDGYVVFMGKGGMEFIYSLWYMGLSLLWPLPLRSTGSGRAGSAATAHGPSRSIKPRILYPAKLTFQHKHKLL